ncbi:Bcr/CflA family multidrug efflux MFS transporter [Bdellovibrio bacteriovorus]|uniref:Bcr/CflA family multidrug efflux MFS transporter n=1 Tax=Bdellovibrio bacteriovorus TaxID=959 RepID=UPI0035A5EA8F
MNSTTTAKYNIPFAALILLLASLTAFGPLSIDMYLPAFPAIAENLGVPLSSVQLSLASFFVGLATGQIFYGPLTDRYGRKKPLYVGLGIYAVASVVCTFTKNVEMLIAFRFLQALGSCSGVVISRAIVRDLFTHQETAKVFSLLMLVMGAAPILAPVLGGQISEHFGWRMIFALLAVISTLCIVLIATFLPETHHPDQRVHIKDSWKIYGSILKDRNFMGYALAGGAAQAGMFAYITGSSFVFINHFGIPAKSFGWVFGSNAVGLILCSQINTRLLKRLSYDAILEKIFVVLAVLGALLATAGILNWGFWGIMIPLFLFIASLGMTFPNSTAGAMATQKKSAGSASALLGTLQYGIAALSSAAVSRLHNGTTMPMCVLMGGFGVLALVLHRVIIKRSL